MLDKIHPLDRAHLNLWYGTRGRWDAPIVFVGESWGAEELRQKMPFVGSSGTELDRMIARAGLDPNDILFTNVVAEQPHSNEMWRFFEPRDTTPKRIRGLAPSPLVRSELCRLYEQITSYPRKLIVGSGNYALWALSEVTGSKILPVSNKRPVPKDLQTWVPSGIVTWRGSMMYCRPIMELGPHPVLNAIPFLPIIHPAAIMREWYLREPTIHDLRVRVPMALRGDWRRNPEPTFFAPPTFEQVNSVLGTWLSMLDRGEPLRLASDIETIQPFMTCIGFADSVDFAISIPFVRKNPDNSLTQYWTLNEEAQIIHLIRCLFAHPNLVLDGQNFVYDTQYIQRYFGVKPELSWDTMLCQNVIFPGVPKALDYLASMYCDYYWYWKEDSKEWDTKGTLEQHLIYNCQDLINTWEIGAAQRAYVTQIGMEAQMAFKMQTNSLCLRMMNRGVLFDATRRVPTLIDLQEKLAKVHYELLQIIPQHLIAPVGKRKDKSPIYWMTSDKQTKQVFYDFLGFRVVKDPKTGQPTTGKKALGQFKLWYPEFSGLINRIKLAGSLENTVNVLKMQTDFDGRVRCSYNPGGAETHRLSSSTNAFGGGTNLQNLTKGEEDE